MLDLPSVYLTKWSNNVSFSSVTSACPFSPFPAELRFLRIASSKIGCKYASTTFMCSFVASVKSSFIRQTQPMRERIAMTSWAAANAAENLSAALCGREFPTVE